jgi:hypothetical protein
MKNTKSITVTAILIGVISMASCKKGVEIQKPLPVDSTAPTSFKEIKVNPTFKWKNAKVISLNIMAANPEIQISNTLLVKLENGSVILTKLHKMNEAYVTNISIPLKANSVIVSYGSIVKTIAISNNNATVNFFKN